MSEYLNMYEYQEGKRRLCHTFHKELNPIFSSVTNKLIRLLCSDCAHLMDHINESTDIIIKVLELKGLVYRTNR